MKLQILSSSSSGNCYILENDHESLMIECGVSPVAMKRSRVRFDKIQACLITHEHGDHSKGHHEITKRGIDIIASRGTMISLGITKKDMDYNSRYRIVKSGGQTRAGGFLILAFNVDHDVREPLGFLIYHEDCGKVLFLTDTPYTKYNFGKMNNVIIEANFCPKIVSHRNKSGTLLDVQRDRVFTQHMSIDTTLKTLKAHDLSEVNNIVLIHLSDTNSNQKEFKQRVQNVAPHCAVIIADSGVTINNFNKDQF